MKRMVFDVAPGVPRLGEDQDGHDGCYQVCGRRCALPLNKNCDCRIAARAIVTKNGGGGGGGGKAYSCSFELSGEEGG